MVRMTCRSFVLATMSLIIAGIASAQAAQLTMEWGYRDWSPASSSTRDLRLNVNIGVTLQRLTVQRDLLEYRLTDTLKGYGTHRLTFRPQYFTLKYLSGNSASIEAYGVWSSVNEQKKYYESWTGYAHIFADAEGFRLFGTTGFGGYYQLDVGFWGKAQGGNHEQGWMTFGSCVIHNQNIK